MHTPARWFSVVAVCVLACGVLAFAPHNEWTWSLPAGFPEPKVPAGNPMSAAKVELGRHLFYDARMSVTGRFSCASCHKQELAFSDGLARSVGATGELHPRSSMSLANIAYSPALTWANPTQRDLERQATVPMFGEDPIELGLSGRERELFAIVSADPQYRALFARAFPGESGVVNLSTITRAIGAFQRSLISGNSPYDRYKSGARNAISASAVRGEALFFDEKTECFHCHGGFTFTGTVDHVGKGFPEVEFHNTGLYNVDGKGGYPAPNTGVHEVSEDPDDMGRFKAPTLRNIAVTAPYMHDGSIATLDEVLDHYAAGGRTVKSGPNAGVGAENPYKSEFLKGFTLTAREKSDLIAFLRSLTDSTFLTDTRYANPWPATHAARGNAPPRGIR